MPELRYLVRSKKALIVGIFILIAIGISIAFLHAPAAADPSISLNTSGPFNPQGAIQYWSARIDAVGADAAYQEFVKTYQNAPYDIQHSAAHVMGDVLYKKLGLKGLAVCDSSFSFGCYHQFFIDAVTASGLGIVPSLDKECVAKYGPMGTGCQHGIGHGLGEYFGYTPAAVLKELTACGMTTTVNQYFGCTSGVFMQYFEPIELTNEQVVTNLHTLDPADPLAPCDTFIPDLYKKSCYYSLPQWWYSLEQPDNTNYAGIGKLCASAPAEYQESCYLGVGSIAAPSVNYDPAQTIAECMQMPNQQAQLLCRASASWALFAMPSYRQDAVKICEGLSGDAEHLCVQKSDLLGDGEIFKAEQQNL